MARWVAALVAVVLIGPILINAPIQGAWSSPWAPFRYSGQRELKQPPSQIQVTAGPRTTATVPIPTLLPTPGSRPGLVEAVITAAEAYLGTPYLWGGCSHTGIDCSCLVKQALATVSIPEPRTTIAQYAFDKRLAQPQVGATIFFNDTCTGCGANPTHEGLVISLNPPLMIHAGDPVQIVSYATPYWQSHLASYGWPPGL